MPLESVEEGFIRWRDRALEAELEIVRLRAELEQRVDVSAERPTHPGSARQMLAAYGLSDGVIEGILEIHAREIAKPDPAAPSLPSPIRPDTQWCWEPLSPRLRCRVRIVGTKWDGEVWLIETEALERSGRRLAGHRKRDELGAFIESAVSIDPDL
jgi:hypothetical protein